MIKEFEQFKNPDTKKITDIPAQWDIEFIVFQIAGDVTKEDWVLDNFSYSKAVKWMLLHRYESFAIREQFKK